MEGGIYVTFFEPGEPFERELPPVGPLDHVVVRSGRLVADRRRADHTYHGADVVKALHAEIELQRALGEEPGGPKRSEMRVTAPDGVFLRFTSLDAAGTTGPELGPFAVVRISRTAVEADGEVLGTRLPTEPPSWSVGGTRRPDIAFRTTTTAYHPRVAEAPVAAAIAAAPTVVDDAPPTVAAPTPIPPSGVAEVDAEEPAPERAFRATTRRPSEVYSPPGSHGAILESAQTLRERQQAAHDRPAAAPAGGGTHTPPSSLRSRIRSGEQQRIDGPLTVGAPDYSTYRAQRPDERVLIAANEAPQHFDARALLWRWRIAIIGVLLVAAGAYAISTALRGGAGDNTAQTVGLAQRFSSAHWDYVVNGTQRAPAAGRASAHGVYYVVRLNATNRGGDDARLLPSDFVLVDANGVQHAAESTASGVYSGNDNPQSPFAWPDAFPAGRTTSVAIVFDVDPTLPKGMTLKVVELPNTTVRLD